MMTKRTKMKEWYVIIKTRTQIVQSFFHTLKLLFFFPFNFFTIDRCTVMHTYCLSPGKECVNEKETVPHQILVFVHHISFIIFLLCLSVCLPNIHLLRMSISLAASVSTYGSSRWWWWWCKQPNRTQIIIIFSLVYRAPLAINLMGKKSQKNEIHIFYRESRKKFFEIGL